MIGSHVPAHDCVGVGALVHVVLSTTLPCPVSAAETELKSEPAPTPNDCRSVIIDCTWNGLSPAARAGVAVATTASKSAALRIPFVISGRMIKIDKNLIKLVDPYIVAWFREDSWRTCVQQKSLL